MKKLSVITFLTVLLASCSHTDEPQPSELPVIEGWIDSGGHPIVMFTSAISPDTDGGELMDKMIRWGKVTISDGEEEIIMTGGRTSEYFPPYRYFTSYMVGRPGRTYTITADYRDMHASAKCYMYEPTKIDSITFRPTEDDDSQLSTTLHFTAPADVPAYYYLTIRELYESPRSLPTMLGCREVVEPGSHVAIPVFNSKQSYNGEPFAAQLKVGHKYIVSLHRIPKEVYDFWSAYDNAVMFGENLLLGLSGSLPANIEGGLGVFSARGTNSKFFVVE